MHGTSTFQNLVIAAFTRLLSHCVSESNGTGASRRICLIHLENSRLHHKNTSLQIKLGYVQGTWNWLWCKTA